MDKLIDLTSPHFLPSQTFSCEILNTKYQPISFFLLYRRGGSNSSWGDRKRSFSSCLIEIGPCSECYELLRSVAGANIHTDLHANTSSIVLPFGEFLDEPVSSNDIP